MTHSPDKWLIVKTNEFNKVFTVWGGGYLDGDFWRCSSVIENVTEEDNYFLFHCESGSTYRCNKNNYGTSSFGSSVLSKVSDKLEVLEDPTEYIEAMKTKNKTNVKGHAPASESAAEPETELPNESGKSDSKREAGCCAPSCSALLVSWDECVQRLQDKYSTYLDSVPDIERQSYPKRFYPPYSFVSSSPSWQSNNEGLQIRISPTHDNPIHQDYGDKYRELYRLLEPDLFALQTILRERVSLEYDEPWSHKLPDPDTAQDLHCRLYASLVPQTNRELPDLPTLEGFQLAMESMMSDTTDCVAPLLVESSSGISLQNVKVDSPDEVGLNPTTCSAGAIPWDFTPEEKEEVINHIRSLGPQYQNSTVILDKSDIPEDLLDQVSFADRDEDEVRNASRQFLSNLRRHREIQNQNPQLQY